VTRPLRVATRGSALARWQAERVLARLGGAGELVMALAAGAPPDQLYKGLARYWKKRSES